MKSETENNQIFNNENNNDNSDIDNDNEKGINIQNESLNGSNILNESYDNSFIDNDPELDEERPCEVAAKSGKRLRKRIDKERNTAIDQEIKEVECLVAKFGGCVKSCETKPVIPFLADNPNNVASLPKEIDAVELFTAFQESVYYTRCKERAETDQGMDLMLIIIQEAVKSGIVDLYSIYFAFDSKYTDMLAQQEVNVDSGIVEEQKCEVVEPVLHYNKKVDAKMKADIKRVNKNKEAAASKGVTLSSRNLLIDRYYICPPEFEWKNDFIDTINFKVNDDIKPAIDKLKPDSNPDFIIAFESFEYAASSLSLICYMDPELYSDNKDENMTNSIYDFNITKIQMMQIVLKFLTIVHNIPVDLIKSITIGHEFSPESGKAHYQCCVQFQKQIKRKWKAYSFESVIKGMTLMMEKARHPKALAKYCQKDGDIIVFGNSDLTIKIIYTKNSKDEEVPDFEATISYNSHKNRDDLKSCLFSKFGKQYMNNYNNINNCINAHVHEELPPFQWIIPEHLENSQNSKHQSIVKHLKSQFFDEEERVKALIICGPNNTGKTRFARSLVNHESYACYVRKEFTKEVEPLLKTAKLLILDDFKYMDGNDQELFKALLSGEKVTVSAKWMQSTISPGYRTIFLTNNLEFVRRIYADVEFTGRFTVVQLDVAERDYLGPEGTYRKDLSMNTGHDIEPEILSYLEEARRHGLNNNNSFTEQWKHKLELKEDSLTGLKYHAGNEKKIAYTDFRLGVNDVNPYDKGITKVIESIDKLINKDNLPMDKFLRRKVHRDDPLAEENRELKHKLSLQSKQLKEQDVKLTSQGEALVRMEAQLNSLLELLKNK